MVPGWGEWAARLTRAFLTLLLTHRVVDPGTDLMTSWLTPLFFCASRKLDLGQALTFALLLAAPVCLSTPPSVSLRTAAFTHGGPEAVGAPLTFPTAPPPLNDVIKLISWEEKGKSCSFRSERRVLGGC